MIYIRRDDRSRSRDERVSQMEATEEIAMKIEEENLGHDGEGSGIYGEISKIRLTQF